MANIFNAYPPMEKTLTCLLFRPAGYLFLPNQCSCFSLEAHKKETQPLKGGFFLCLGFNIASFYNNQLIAYLLLSLLAGTIWMTWKEPHTEHQQY
jgi:hypothetical protein